MKKLLLLLVIAIFGYNNAINAQSCDTLRNWDPNAGVSSLTGVNGYVPGHETLPWGDVLRWAEPYNVPSATEVRGIRIGVHNLQNPSGVSSLTLRVWENNAGIPGNVLGTEVIDFDDIDPAGPTQYAFNILEFATPVTVNGDFFVGYELDYSNANDSIGVVAQAGSVTNSLFLNTVSNGWEAATIYGTNISSIMDVLVSNSDLPVPDFVSTSTLEICEGASFELDADGYAVDMTEYNWELWTWDPIAEEIVDLIDQDAGSPQATLTPNGVGEYAIALYSEQNCSFEAVLYNGFEVLPEFQYDLNVTDESCLGQDGAIELTNFSGGLSDYVYSWTPNNYYIYGSPSEDTTGLEAGTYTLNFGSVDLDGGNFNFLTGCEVTEVVTVDFIPGEEVTVGSGSTICAGNSATLTASGNGTIEWFDGTNSVGTGTSISVSPNTTTTYEAVLTDVNNCEDSDFIEVTVDAQDDASFTFNNFCVGASNAPTNIVTTGGTFSFNPAPSDGATINASTGEITDGVLGTTYSVQYETFGTCPDQTVENVTVQSNDDPNFEYLLTCDGNSIVPSNIATAGGTFSFSTAPTGGESIDANTGEISGGTVGSVYSVEYITPAGVCQSSAIEQVEIFGLPTVDAGSDALICEGDQAELEATGANTYAWDNNLGTGANQSVFPTTTTVYTVTGTDGNGCENTDQVEVTVNALPSIDAGSDQEVCEGEEVTLEALNPDGASITWNGSVSEGVAFTPALGATTYTVTAELNNCESTDDVVVTVGAVPTVSAGSDAEACLNHEPISLSGSPAGGTFSGPGVTGSTFNPADAGEGVHEVVYTFADGNGCEGEDIITITVDGCLSLQEQTLRNNVLIAPNPAVTHFNIKVGTYFIINSITVLSAEGRVVKSINVNPSTETTVDVSGLSKGTYFVKIRTASEEVTKKIIVH